MRSNLINITGALLAATILFGCVDKNPDTKVQGQDFETIRPIEVEVSGTADNSKLRPTRFTRSKLIETGFTMTTLRETEKVEFSSANKVIIEDGSVGINYNNIVSFETNDPLLSGRSDVARMTGKAGKTYRIQHELTPHHLVIYKVVPEADISTLEKTYSKKNGSEWSVPIGGYSIIGFFNVEYIKNSEDRDTSRQAKFPVVREKFETAQYYEIDKESFNPFTTEYPVDLVPKSLFATDTEWYFSETTVYARTGIDADVGKLDGRDGEFNAVSRVKFLIQDGHIYGFNTNIDKDYVVEDNNLNYNLAIKIPITPTDFRRSKTGSFSEGLSLEEITYENIDDNRFLRVQYDQVDTVNDNLVARLFQRITNFSQVIDIKYGDDFISFAIEDGNKGIIKRYSFLKVQDADNFEGRRLFKTDNRQFGAFSTRQAKRFDYKVTRQDDLEKLDLMARHDPTKDIVYRFSKSTPKGKWYRDIARETFNVWQQAFEKAGLDINIELKEDFDVDLGDIRYNVVSIFKFDIGGSLGFGPSLTDSSNGRIVSASANLGMSDIIERHYRLIRSYLGRKSGRQYDFYINNSTQIPDLFKLVNAVNQSKYSMNLELTEESQNGYLSDVITSKTTFTDPEVAHLVDENNNVDLRRLSDVEKEILSKFNLPSVMPVNEFIKTVVKLEAQDHGLFSAVGHEYNQLNQFSITNYTDQVIDNHCSEVKDLATRMQSEFVDTIEEINIIEPCVMKFAQMEATWAMLHEVGHNLSLRHNFLGNYDTANFASKEDYTLDYVSIHPDFLKGKSSTVMDYLSMEGFSPFPGGYDLAALRWIYKEEVQLKNGQWQKIPTTQSIDQASSSRTSSFSKKDMKPFMFCTDQQRVLGTSPLCKAFDNGSTPLEAVKSQIDEATKMMGAFVYRLNKVGTIQMPIQGSFGFLKHFYDQWRFYVQKYTGTEKAYLQSMSVEEYQAVIDRMLNDSENSKTNKEFLKIRNLIVSHVVDMMLLENKYCVVKKSDGEESLLELKKIRQEMISAGSNDRVSSCKSVEQTYLKDKEYTLLKEVGHFLRSGRYELDPSLVLERDDFSGVANVRLEAAKLLGSRNSPSINNRERGFVPAMLDEPDVRKLVKEIIEDRILNGVRLDDTAFDINTAASKTTLFGEDDIKKYTSGKVYVNFKDESNLVTNFYVSLFNANVIPGDINETFKKMTPYSVQRTNNIRMVQAEMADSYFNSQFYFWIRDTETIGGRLMSKLKEIDTKEAMTIHSDEALIETKVQFAAMIERNQIDLSGETLLTLDHINRMVTGVRSVMAQQGALPQWQYLGPLLFDTEFKVMSNFIRKLIQRGIPVPQLMQTLNSPESTDEQKEETRKTLEKLFNVPAAPEYGEYFKNAKDEVSLVFKKLPLISTLDMRLKQILSERTEKIEAYQKDEAELQAQKSLILQIMSSTAR